MNNVPATFLLYACIFLSGLWANPAQAQTAQSYVDKAKQLSLAEKPEWRRLVHYRKKWLRGWRSEADGHNFFVSADGKSNPEAELEATLRGFFSNEKRKLEGPGEPAQSVRCQFPARYLWLNQELQLDAVLPSAEQAGCKDYEEFRRRVSAKAATMVFSSFDVKNPSSAFGHSLLRLSKSTSNVNDSENHQLLDQGINYAANPTTSNPLLYGIFGLVGLFPGTFSNIPFYFKVREYTDFESRDLWEYDLNLSQVEIDRLVAHIWELGSAIFMYYYLTDNCSYHMLTILEVAAPRLNLLEHVPFWIIPSDTIKALFYEPGFVKDVHFRPSINTQFKTRLARLSPEERAEIPKLIEAKSPAVSLPDPVSRAKVLDTYIDYIDLHNSNALQDKKPDIIALKQSVLLARSRLPMTDPLIIPNPLEAAPHLSHGSERIMLRQAQSQNLGPATGFAVRFALHDLLDPQVGLPNTSEVEFASADVRWYERDNVLRLEDLAFLAVAAYKPLNRYEQSLSWRIRMGADRVYDPRCENCVAGFFRGGAGGTLQLLQNPNLLTYALLEGSVETSPSFVENKLTTLVGPTLGVRFGLFPNAWFLTEARYRTNLNTPIFEETRIDSSLRVSPIKEWALDAKAEFGKFDRVVSFAIAHYF